MKKLASVCVMGALFAGCAPPMADTALDHPSSSYVGTNGPANGPTPANGTLNPSRDELNRTGPMEQNGGVTPSGATGNSASQ